MSILEVRDVTYRYVNKYQTVNALNGVDCAFEEGKLYALVGKSGSGKSTLLSLMAGLMLPTSGEICFEGKPTSQINLNRYRREHAAVIYQSFRLLPLLTVSENVTYPMELRGFKGKPAREKAEELIQRVGLPATVLPRFPDMLSGGEQQRVAVARALMNNPELILADEPSGNLDTDNAKKLHQLFFDLRDQFHQTFIIVTHNEELASLSDRKIILKDGQVQS